MGKEVPVLDAKQRKELEERMNLLKQVAEFEERMPEGMKISGVGKRAQINLDILTGVSKESTNIPQDVQEQDGKYFSIDDVLTFEVAGSSELSLIVAKQAKQEIALSKVKSVADTLGLEVQDIVDIMKETGMKLEEVQEIGEALKIELAEVGKSVEDGVVIVPQELSKEGVVAKARGESKTREDDIVDVEIDEDSLTVTRLDELARVDEDGHVEVSEYLKDQFEAYEEMGIVVDVDSLELTLTEEEMEQEEQPLEEDGERTVLARPGRTLTAKTDETLEDEKDKDEQFKAEVAESIGAKRDDILAAIIIHDRDVGSQMFNQKLSKTANEILLVRLPNNRFELLEKDTSGEYHQLQGLEVTALGNKVAPLLKDKVGGLYTHLYPGEAVAGKTVEGQTDYDIFQIRAAGESIDDGLNHMVYVSCNGKSRMDVITNVNGGYELDFAKTTSVYPESVVMNGKEMQVEDKQEEPVARRKEFDNNFSGSYLEEALLLEELLAIDREIAMIQAEPDISLSTIGSIAKDFVVGAAEGALVGGEIGATVGGVANAVDGLGENLEEAKEDREQRISELEAKRSAIQSRLGYSDLYQARQDALEIDEGRQH